MWITAPKGAGYPPCEEGGFVVFLKGGERSWPLTQTVHFIQTKKMKNNQFQRLTFNLPAGQFASDSEEELIATLIYNLKRETWDFVKQNFGVALYQTPEGVHFTIPTGMSVENIIKDMSIFFKQRWCVVLPEITFSVDPVDHLGYLV